MRVSLFDFDLPAGAIADRPAVPRESARLLRITAGGLADHVIADLPGLLEAGDCLVVNDTRVIPARLFGSRDGVDVEVLLHMPEPDGAWLAMARPLKRLKTGQTVTFEGGLKAEVLGRTDGGFVRLRFDRHDAELQDYLDAHGHIPLPPYIARADDARDRDDYQTVFAADPGAVAAPTAGLHFTPALLERLPERGIKLATVTLHVGAGTFLPVKAEDTDGHVMHAERGIVTATAADAVNETRARGGRVVAVGTTSLRLLETAAKEDGSVVPFSGASELFITPGYRFKAVDMLMTNFHLPRSTLLMLVSALAGRERMLAAYAYAVEAGYRFYSYGDACLIDRIGDGS